MKRRPAPGTPSVRCTGRWSCQAAKAPAPSAVAVRNWRRSLRSRPRGRLARTRAWASGSRLAVAGRVRRPLAVTAAELDRGDTLTATLDCTGGFFSTQHWRGVSLGRLLDEAGVEPGARHVRVISRTGYRWSFGLGDARALLLATHVGGEALSHGHGAPCRLVAPGRRGFQWVKWVERVEVHQDPDPGAVASTLWSSFTAAGRGAA